MRKFLPLMVLIFSCASTLLAQPERSAYCMPSANCTFGDGISGFVFAGIENLSSGCSTGGFGDFTEMTASVEIGGTYTASFSSNYNDQKASLWIDLNNDTLFSANERFIADLALEHAGEMYESDIEIPMNARPGTYRLRVGTCWQVPSSSDPCAELSYGEWEDYHVQLTGTPVQTNIAVESIQLEPVMPATPLRPYAVISNFGMDSARFKVYMHEWTTGYESYVQFWNLPPGETKWARFDTLDLPPGKYNISVYAYPEGDEIPEDNFKAKWVTFTEQPRQKVITELFTGTWSNTNSNASRGLELLQQDYADTLGVVAWHIGDEFETPEALERDAWYRNGGYPTLWVDGLEGLYGAYVPDNYFYYKPYIKQRVPTPSAYRVSLVISEVDENTLNIRSTVTLLHGNSDENLAAFVLLTESNLPSPGNANQDHVVRKVFPNATTGLPLDFSFQNTHTHDTQISFDDNMVMANCEVVVLLQNMDTREIYQSNSRMANDITNMVEQSPGKGMNIYPNPAGSMFFISAAAGISHVSIYNPFGKLVFETAASTNKLIVNSQNFSPGLYLVTVRTKYGLITEKIVIGRETDNN